MLIIIGSTIAIGVMVYAVHIIRLAKLFDRNLK